MDRLAFTEKIAQTIKKYRFVLIVLAAGILLMLLPMKQEDAPVKIDCEAVSPKSSWDITDALTEILSKVEGAGEVKILLTVAKGESTIYQQDSDITSGENGSIRQETVIITDSNRNQSGLIQQIDPPVYRGAIIVCQGADNDVVRLHIIQAVAKITGLGTDKITVLKMK